MASFSATFPFYLCWWFGVFILVLSVFKSHNLWQKFDYYSRGTRLLWEDSIAIVKKLSKIASNNSNLQSVGSLLNTI